MHTNTPFCNKTLFIFLLTCACLINSVYAQNPTPGDSLMQVLISKEKEMFAITYDGNKAAAEKMFGPDYITINADGVIQGKEKTMKTFGRFKGATGTLSDKKVRVYENIAIITGRAKAYVKGILVADFLYTESWIYRDHQWQFIGWQGTMTGLPSWYPVIITAILLVLLYLIVLLIAKKLRKSRKAIS